VSVTVRFGAQDESGHDHAQAQETSPAVVYLAAARNTYGTTSYRGAAQAVAEVWPRAVVMDAEACGFASRADWSLRWPFIRDGIDCLVVLAEDDGSISRDTWLECRDARESGLSCWFVSAAGALVPLASFHFRLYPVGTRTERRWAQAEVRPVT